MPIPIRNRDDKAIPNDGIIENRKAPVKATKKEIIIAFFEPYFSIITPAGTDITPYAMKKENGKKPANPRLKLKLTLIFGRIEFRILVINDITKKMRKIKPTM
jgi:hypothetical protein